MAPGMTSLGESSCDPPMVVGAEQRVKRAGQGVVTRGGLETEGVLEDFEVAVGGEEHVGVVVGQVSNSEVRDERTTREVGTVAGDVQVRGSKQQGGTPAGNLRRGLDGEDQIPGLLDM